jgi:hypothetical protein
VNKGTGVPTVPHQRQSRLDGSISLMPWQCCATLRSDVHSHRGVPV